MSKLRFDRMMRISQLARHVAITLSICSATIAETIRILHL
jgi:hypothetical protein